MYIMRKNKILLRISLVAFLAFAVLFTSCSNDDDEKEVIIDDQPGEISGLGDAPGELTGIEFTLPNGVELEGDIYGASSQYSLKTKGDEVEESDFDNLKASVNVIGSGKWVQVAVRLKNLTNRDIDVIFPARLVVKSLSNRYQNGVLLKKTKTTVLANETHSVALLMYCGNKNLSPSSSYQKYEWAVISNSSLIVDLCNRLANKKINYEEFTDSKSVYGNQVGPLQSILWRLTDGSGLSDSDIEYIESLPNS